MADHVESKIAEALFAHLAAMPGAPPIVWPNQSAAPPVTGQYLRVSHQPNRTRQSALGDAGPNRHEGLIQITVVDRQSAGLIPSMETAGKIAARFRRDTVLARDGVEVRMQRPPSAAGMLITDGGWAETPVTAWWWCDAPNPT